MQSEHAAHGNAPLNRFIGLIEAENCFHLEAVIFPRLLFGIVIKEVFVWSFILSDVASPELMDALDFLRIGASSFIKASGLCFTLSDGTLSCQFFGLFAIGFFNSTCGGSFLRLHFN